MTAASKPAAWKILWRLGQAFTFTIIEVLAGHALHGALAAAVYAIAVWNVFVIVLIIVGVSQLAAKAVKAGLQ